MKDYTIFLDLDGVITDFVGDTAELFGYSRDDIYARLSHWSLHQELGVSEKQMWERISIYGEDFWSRMTMYNHASFLIKQLSFLGNVIFLSSPGLLPSAYSGKVRWLRANIKDFNNKYIFTDNKHLLAGRNRILIDDKLEHINKFNEYGGIGICFPQPWNLSCSELKGMLLEPDRTHRIVKEVKRIVKKEITQLELPFHFTV